MKKKLKQVAQEIIKEEEETKIKPPQIEVEEVEIEVPSDIKKLLAKVIKLNFNFLSKKYGEKWKLTDEELDELTNAYNDLAKKYLPAIVGKFSVELNVIFCTTFVILKRVI